MSFTLDRRSNTPLAKQVEYHFRKLITQGEWIAGQALPQAHNLAEKLNLDLDLVQHAIQALIQDDYLYLQFGQIFISNKTIPTLYLGSFLTLYEIIKQLGYHARIETLEVKKVTIDSTLYPQFPENDALYFKRLYFGDDHPLFYVESYLPYTRYAQLESTLRLNQPYYQNIMDLGIQFKRIDRSLQAVTIDEPICALLKAPKNSVGTHGFHRSYDSSNELIEVMNFYALAENLHFIYETDA